MPHLKVNRKLERFLTKSKPIKIAIGGRGSGKSIGFGDIFTMKMATERADIYCLREFQDSVTDSVHRVFKDSIQKRLQLEGWDVQHNTVIAPNGARTAYKGANRNPDSMQSAQGYKYSWFEEAHRASQDSIDKLLPTILRNPGAECWFSANPQNSNDPFSKRFIVPYISELEKNGYYEDDIHLIQVVNWRDNPWWNEEQEALRKWDYENLDRAKYDWIWEGKFNDTVEDAIILPEWFDAAIDAHITLGIKPRGQIKVAHDPADSGDARAYAVKHGILIKDVQQNEKDDVNDSCDWALDRAIEERADVFIWDADGMGLSLRGQIKKSLEGKKIQKHEFRGSDGPEHPDKVYMPMDDEKKGRKNKEVFKNLRAQKYIQLADKFHRTYRAIQAIEAGQKAVNLDEDEIISISSDIKDLKTLRSELCRIPREPSGAGLVKIMGKPDMKKKLKIDSPNMADCVMMLETDAIIRKERKPLKVDTSYVV